MDNTPTHIGINDDERFMRMALREAEAAAAEDEVPVGAVIVHEGIVIARAHDQRETLKDPTAHAEMIAITQAAQALDAWRLEGATMYVTIEPCPMCAGALVMARVSRLVYGARSPKSGACGTLYNIVTDERLNHRLKLTPGILAKEAAEILKNFFTNHRGHDAPDSTGRL